MKTQNGQHITLVGSLHCAEQCSVEHVTIHNGESAQGERKAEKRNTLTQPMARSAGLR